MHIFFNNVRICQIKALNLSPVTKRIILLSMKKSTILTLLALSAGVLNAENRTLSEAQAIAQQFLSEKTGQPVEISTMRRAARIGTRSDAATQPYYAFNDTENDAFVIVSGTTLTRPILAHGEGHIAADVDDADMPEGLRWWLNAISERTEYLEQHPEEAETEAQLSATTETVAPILDGIAWDQDGAYSLMTPSISGTQCPVGCVATAMAQIIRYYKAPSQGTGSHSYTWKYTEDGTSKSKTLSVDYSAQTYNYLLMPKYISRTNPANEEQQNEVAKLSYHCGVAVNMSYDPEGSGTSSSYVDRALIKNFGYNSKIAQIMRSGYTYDEWIEIMHNELKEGRPILYSGMSNDEDSGHAFILEGYNEEGLFYINWGWNGSYNAYYDIAVLNPSGTGTGATMMSDGLCESQEAVVNISPTQGAGKYRTTLFGGGNNTFTSSRSSTNLGSSVNITVKSIYNHSAIKIAGEYGIAIVQNGTVIQKTKMSSVSVSAISDTSVSGFNINNSYTIPSNLSNGTYQAYVYFKPTASDEYDLVRMPRTTYESYLQLVVSGNSVTISRPMISRDITASNWSFNTTNPTTKTEYMTVDLKNNSSEAIVGEFALLLKDSSNSSDTARCTENCLTIPAGETKTATFVYTFTKNGSWTSNLYFKPWNLDVTSGSTISGTTQTFTVDIDNQAGAIFKLNDAPTIVSRSEDGKFYRNSPVTATFNVTNTGYQYKGTFAIWLYARNTNPSELTPVGQYEGSVSVAGDGTAHDVSINFNLDLSSLSKNVSYYARPYYFNGNEWMMFNNNDYTKMNIYGNDAPSGISEVIVDEPENDLRNAQVFNVLGKRISMPASGQLPKGIYIVNGRKMVIK